MTSKHTLNTMPKRAIVFLGYTSCAIVRRDLKSLWIIQCHNLHIKTTCIETHQHIEQAKYWIATRKCNYLTFPWEEYTRFPKSITNCVVFASLIFTNVHLAPLNCSVLILESFGVRYYMARYILFYSSPNCKSQSEHRMFQWSADLVYVKCML